MHPKPMLSPDPVPRCPRCGKTYHASYLTRGTTFPQCQQRHCGQRWWAMVLRPGAVLPQLVQVFEDEQLALRLVEAYHLPESLTVRCFWQFPISNHDARAHLDASPATLFRSMHFLPDVRPDPSLARG